MSAPRAPERAAGGLVWRQVPSGPEVVLVHRPAYDDWAFPKGKVKPGESDEDAALREVAEEAGLGCRLGTELPSTTYPLQGRLKTVRYWAMTVQRAPRREPVPTPEGAKEVDQVCWVALAEARSRLSYARDVLVLDALTQAVPLARGSGTGTAIEVASEIRGHDDNGVLEDKPQRDGAQEGATGDR